MWLGLNRHIARRYPTAKTTLSSNISVTLSPRMYVYIFRHLDKGVAGAGRPPSLLVVATSSVKSL